MVEQIELRYSVPCTDTEVQTPVGQDVDHCALLGDLSWMMQRCNENRRAEPDSRSACCDSASESQWRTEVVVIE
jgi:hypothetical protein